MDAVQAVVNDVINPKAKTWWDKSGTEDKKAINSANPSILKPG